MARPTVQEPNQSLWHGLLLPLMSQVSTIVNLIAGLQVLANTQSSMGINTSSLAQFYSVLKFI